MFMLLFLLCWNASFVVVVLWVLFAPSFLVPPPLSSFAVFKNAAAFNSDVSKWNTGKVADMNRSKSLSISVATLPCFVFSRRHLEFSSDPFPSHHTHVVLFFVVGMVLVLLLLLLLLWAVLSLFCCIPLSHCSVYCCCCVQSRRVQMEYGKGVTYGCQ